MKKSLLAFAALPGAFALSAHAQSSVTLYGVIDTGLAYASNQGGHGSWQQVSASTENTVFGLRGSEDLGGGLHAVFKLENGFNANSGSLYNAGDAFGEQAYAGLQDNTYGTLLIGRQFDTFNDMMGPLAAAGGSYGGSLAAHPFDNDNLAADSMSVNDVVKYTSNAYDGVSFEGMYAFGNKAGNFADNRAWGFSAAYSNGPVNLAAGYLELGGPGGGADDANPDGAVARDDGSADFVAQRQRIWGAGGNYTFGKATVGLLWTHSQIGDMADVYAGGLGYAGLGGNLRLDNYELNARYALTPALSIAGAYTFTDGAYGDGAASASPDWNQFTLQTDYTFSKRTDVYLEGVYQHVHGGPADSVLDDAMINTLSPSSTQTQVAVEIGLRHQF
ncbi:porin [Burkholderia sp. WAC0059]|uniref:porin n=1 Tax=Burkholderia sp. WAC0059 TaxID=2066022 RepID=UPI000C7EC139|nr:porin [Burkholderia sp. WAC0059]PLZ02581.1 porin [Burkholderia sp. WAC0059]